MGVLKIFTDGGARGNPGIGAAAFIIKNDSGEDVFKKGEFLKNTTNNNAEYRGVEMAMEWLEKEGAKYDTDSAEFFIDSELVVKQLNGLYKIKDANLQNLAKHIQAIRQSLSFKIIFTHVRREKNREADLLVNQTIDGNI